MKGRVSVSWGASNWATPVHFFCSLLSTKKPGFPSTSSSAWAGKIQEHVKCICKSLEMLSDTQAVFLLIAAGLGFTKTSSLLALGRGCGVTSQETLQDLVPLSAEAGRGPTALEIQIPPFPALEESCTPHPLPASGCCRTSPWNRSGKGTQRGGSCAAQLSPKTALELPKYSL